MGLRQRGVRRSVAKKKSRSGIVKQKQIPKAKLPTSGLAHTFLLGLHKYTKGKLFQPSLLCKWLRHQGAHFARKQQVPDVAAARRLLKRFSLQNQTWNAVGIRYKDPDGDASVNNVEGFSGGIRKGWVGWHEHGHMYRIECSGKSDFRVIREADTRRISCSIRKQNIGDFKDVVVFNPRVGNVAVAPQFSIIYLHSFSLRGMDYFKFPQYFGISDASVRVVLPTAPYVVQTCFKDWNVWNESKQDWQRIRFRSWFDYITDLGGTRENEIAMPSLTKIRGRIHALLRSEVQRMGGDASRVLIGGCSQGCCVALDAAMTYPEVLGGLVGCVGHLLGCTPLDPAKRTMPMYLFHERSDKEMRWNWVQRTVQRLMDGGFDVHVKRERDPEGGGHWIHEIEGLWITEGIRAIAASRSRA